MIYIPNRIVHSVQEPVHGSAVIFSLSLCALARGLFDPVDPQSSWEETLEECTHRAAKRWNNDLDAVMRELDDDSVAAPTGSLIGWPVRAEHLARCDFYRLCIDSALTIRVLSRCVGHLYLGGRAPRLEWEQLFSKTAFAFDDARFDGIDLCLLGITAFEKPTQEEQP